MARIAGVDLPNKHVNVALTYIYGIGRSSANSICKKTGVNPEVQLNALSQDDLAALRAFIDANYKIEGRLRTEIGLNIKRLMDIGCYRGLRHRKGLPVRGQRTRTNSRTRKGKRKTVAGKKI
ncbi:MAG: 30S ribosomal protein S13 [Spirochaetaceae bacterium]|jgi:small subunit ribosomal protein S13|nr:30S ribosomal protein S13 [Spirochaetaceae bacterium]